MDFKHDMTRTELLEIIHNGESSGVEFKRDVVQNHALAKELVAFSNFEGGIVLLGIEDDGSVKRNHAGQP
jgi:ATP-dependent DNA helicase RecG